MTAQQPILLARRTFLARSLAVAGLPLIAAACASPAVEERKRAEAERLRNADFADMYGEIEDNGEVIPAVDVSQVKRRNLRQLVDYQTSEPVGTVIVDPRARFLYIVAGDGQAMRYGVGVAKAGLAFEGRAYIGRKAIWPRWVPTRDMIRREPKRYGPYAGGLPGGMRNPLGARALYLYKNNTDTLYRIHGTNEPWSIGERVSSGCIRLFNQDIIDVFSRVPTGTRVVVLAAGRIDPDDIPTEAETDDDGGMPFDQM